MVRPTRSQGNYLKAIHALSPARLTDVANHLGVSKASACVAVARLEDRGWVRKEDKDIALTPEGEREVRRVIDNFSIVQFFLTEKLNVDPRTAQTDAGALEYAVSDETIDALRLFLQRKG